MNMDLTFPVPHLPAPGETVLCPSFSEATGGKGMNQAIAAARAGAHVSMIGCIGRDAHGDAVLQVLAGDGVETDQLRLSDAATGCAVICVDEAGENQIAVASGANRSPQAGDVPDLRLGPDRLLLMQMEIPHPAVWAVAARAKALGSRVIVNLAPAAPVAAEHLAHLDVLVVNELEGQAVARDLGIDDADPVAFARSIAAAHGLTVVMTLGGDGAVAIGPEGGWRIAALPIQPVDTTGAGDAFCGVLAASLDGSAAWPEALRRASVGAALTCLDYGAQAALPTEAAITAKLGDVPPAEAIA